MNDFRLQSHELDIDWTAKIKECHDLIDTVLDKYKCSSVIGMFSGGHDSLTACHVASLHPKFTAMAHMNTGIGVRQTREFVYETCNKHNWKLYEKKAAENTKADGTPDPMIYKDIVIKHGFPGPGQHFMMFSKLKDRPLRMLIRELKTKHLDKIMLISGVRSDESVRRMGNVELVFQEGARIWTSIIHNWTAKECQEYIRINDLKRNPVVDKLCKSGECLCGAYAAPGEMIELEEAYPEAAAEIRELEVLVKAAGHKRDWNEMPKKKSKGKGGMMCTNCQLEFEFMDNETTTKEGK